MAKIEDKIDAKFQAVCFHIELGILNSSMSTQPRKIKVILI